MSKQDKETTKKEQLNIGQRDRFKVTIFADEYDVLGLDSDMSLYEAQSAVREQLPVPIASRAGSSVPVAPLAKAIAGASSEVRAQIVALLKASQE